MRGLEHRGVGVSRARPARLPARSRRGEAASVRLSCVGRAAPPPASPHTEERQVPAVDAPDVPTTGVFRRLPCLPSRSVGCGCWRSGTGDQWRGSARLGGRLGGSTRRLSLASATWLVGGALLLLVLPRRFFVVSLSCGYVIRAHAHATRRGITRGAVTIEKYSALIPLLQRQVLCVDTTASTPSTLR